MNVVKFVIAAISVVMLPYAGIGAELPVPFGYLATLNIDHQLKQHGFTENISIYFDASITNVIDTLLTGDFDNGGFGVNRRLLTTKILRDSDVTYTIDFSPGMSADPCFIIFRNDGYTLKRLTNGIIGGTQLIVPGDGFLYISGHTNNTFNQRRKYRIDGDTIFEVKQPCYYVGLESVTNREIKLWNDPDAEDEYNLVATLPKGSQVIVLLKQIEQYPNYTYLVRTPFGLTGWVRFKTEELFMWTDPNPIEGLFYRGD
ncbi:MAG: SH3 domain-containing protein [Candidatus Latescibacteria bacterium]|nr:SH3 domain-containing protein [Candidatus Latescibacterota bacterium]